MGFQVSTEWWQSRRCGDSGRQTVPGPGADGRERSVTKRRPSGRWHDERWRAGRSEALSWLHAPWTPSLPIIYFHTQTNVCDAWASATSDLQLPSQLQGFTAHWLVPNYTAWWQRHMCVNNLPRVALDIGAAGIRTRDLIRPQFIKKKVKCAILLLEFRRGAHLPKAMHQCRVKFPKFSYLPHLGRENSWEWGGDGDSFYFTTSRWLVPSTTCEMVMMVWRNGVGGAVWDGSVCSGRRSAAPSRQHSAAPHGALLSNVSHARGVRTPRTGRPALSRLLPCPASTAVGKHLVRIYVYICIVYIYIYICMYTHDNGTTLIRQAIFQQNPG